MDKLNRILESLNESSKVSSNTELLNKVSDEYGVIILGRDYKSPTLAPGNKSGTWYYTDNKHTEDYPLVISSDDAISIYNKFKNKEDYSSIVKKYE